MSRLAVWCAPGLLGLTLLLSACGSGTTSTSTFTPSGGGGGGSTASTSTNVCTPTNEQNSVARSVGGTNVSTVYMDYCAVGGTANAINIPYVSVYVCAPGSTTNCAWIDHIEVDTGSVGLRVVAAALPSTLLNALPQVSTGGLPTGECYDFVLSYFWGGLRQADLQFGGTVAPNANAGSNGVRTVLPATIQVINDPLMPASPCTNSTGTPETTVGFNQTTQKPGIGANGILGVGLFQDDGGPNFFYFYTCPSPTAACTQTQAAAAVPNPVSLLSSAYSTGVVMKMDSAAAIRNNATFYNYAGNIINYSAVAGSLTFGGFSGPPTAAPAGVNFFLGDNQLGLISAAVAGTNLTHAVDSTGFPLDSFGAFFDSGTNALYFRAADIPALPVAVCPANVNVNNFACINTGQPNPFAISPLLFGNAGTVAAASIAGNGLVIYDYNYLFSTAGIQNGPAYEGLTAVETSTAACTTVPTPTFCRQFDFGLPFFLGRTLYFGIANLNTAGQPFYGI